MEMLRFVLCPHAGEPAMNLEGSCLNIPHKVIQVTICRYRFSLLRRGSPEGDDKAALQIAEISSF